MKILLVRPAASGGLAAHVDHERALLAAAGRDVAEAQVRIGERPHLAGDVRTVRTLRAALRGSRTPVTLHAHGLRAGALAALAIRGVPDRRLVVTLHNRTVGSPMTRAVGAVLMRLIARGADTVLAVSPDLVETARRAGARDVRHAVIPAPDPRAPSRGPEPRDEETGDRFEILVIARLAVQKGLHDLLDAVALLPDHESVRFRIAGDGPLRDELAARIRAQRLPVALLGRRDDVPALLAASDLVVSAAHWEGQPVALQEALRAGRAIVATDAGGTRWVTGDAGVLVSVGDAPALADAITAMRDPAARHAAEAASLLRARDLPTAADLLSQLDEVLAPGPHAW